LVPLAIPGFTGVIVRETSVAGVTESVVAPETLPDAAVIVVEPAAADVANPLLPAALQMVATPLEEELQVAVYDMSCVVLSE
jgi:hypothetical protein